METGFNYFTGYTEDVILKGAAGGAAVLLLLILLTRPFILLPTEQQHPEPDPEPEPEPESQLQLQSKLDSTCIEDGLCEQVGVAIGSIDTVNALNTGIGAIGLEAEALAMVQAAQRARSAGKSDQALKLAHRAVALSPTRADTLLALGELLELLEATEQGVLTADDLYAKALALAPGHSLATRHRARTALRVAQIDTDALQKLDAKREALAAIPNSDSALRHAKKETYFQHVYHTVGIEGNTMTLQQTRSVLETRLAVEGKSIDEHNEILGLDAAMKYINSTLIHRVGFIAMEDIFELHKRILGYVDPTEGGYFRRTQVYVGGFVPPGPNKVNKLMEQFLDWLNSDEARKLHPVRLAAQTHYKLVYIHPFIDGNGRTARLLMNLILMQAGYPPVIILKQHRHLYYQHLKTANNYNLRPFERFIADCTEKTLDLYLWATNEFSNRVPALGQPIILNIDEEYMGDSMTNNQKHFEL